MYATEVLLWGQAHMLCVAAMVSVNLIHALAVLLTTLYIDLGQKHICCRCIPQESAPAEAS